MGNVCNGAALVGAVLIISVLAGCQSTAPTKVASSGNVCVDMVGVVSSPYATPGQVALAMEIIKSRGCLPQQQSAVQY